MRMFYFKIKKEKETILRIWQVVFFINAMISCEKIPCTYRMIYNVFFI